MRGDSRWSSFAEREVKGMVSWLLIIVYNESMVSDIGRVCLREIDWIYVKMVGNIQPSV